ncbi:mpv17-like protein [Oratosquilla oratoria]|uniref:mpv17-like protein n=1 Tax=Oratosquilla oratoria TaxID=337810 RepID=UPI003F765960
MMHAIRAAFGRHPVLGNMVVYGSLYTGAEFFQQTFNNKIMVEEDAKPEPYDTGALARYGVMGTFVFPHVLYNAYKLLDAKFIGNALPVVMKKLSCDALIVTPINLTLFYVGMSFMEGKKDLFEEWRKKIIPTFVTASGFWVPAGLINFRYLPPQARVVFVGSCQVVWVSILCWFKRQEF